MMAAAAAGRHFINGMSSSTHTFFLTQVIVASFYHQKLHSLCDDGDSTLKVASGYCSLLQRGMECGRLDTVKHSHAWTY